MYKQHCEDLNGPLHDHVTATYGVKRDSILNQSRYFHVVEALAPDIILEGCLMYEVKELLNYYVNHRKFITLDKLNSRIEAFSYGYLELKNKPSTIRSLTGSNHALKQSGLNCSIQFKLLIQ